MNPQLIDTHCHLYLSGFREDIEMVIERAENEGVTKFYLPCIDRETIDDLLLLEKSFPGRCIPMMGLHPCSVKGNVEEEIRWVEDWLSRRPFGAVGEIGLDYYWDKTFIREQQLAFHRQTELAIRYRLPIVIHSRESLPDCIDLVKEHQQGSLSGIFHCFTGDYESAVKIIDAGFYLGIGGVITYKNSTLPEVLTRIPLEHLVLETDAPYLAPVPFRGKRNESAYIKYVAQKLAEVKNMEVEEVARVTTANAQKIFGSWP